MKQNNLWIAALALGITLSAHGQQSGGGISPTMLQQIKQSYPSDVGSDISYIEGVVCISS